DPIHARKMLDSGMEEKGLVRVTRKRTFRERNDPLIRFTDKALPFLLPLTEDDRSHKIQKVKVADEKIGEIQIGEKQPQGIPVSFTIVRNNPTPFITLLGKKALEIRKYRVYFIESNEGWILEKRY